jgi:hypothetical protein
MWRREGFDPDTIDRELGWASDLGFNAVRVFLHDLLWAEDRDGFITRIDDFLGIAASHGIGVLFVIFDGVWDPEPQWGPQPAPRPGVHNSRWVQSPGAAVLGEPARWDALAEYVQGLLTTFAEDARVLGWDLFNEPDNPNRGTYHERELPNKGQAAEDLLSKTFDWARAVGPSQPLTAGVWVGSVTGEEVPSISRLMLEQSDVISFHSYLDADRVLRRIEELSRLGRPVWLTEFLARGLGSTFEGILPVVREHKVGAFCWGLVSGKSQTIYPWDSWARAYSEEPTPWFHDVLRADGSPYRTEETALIRRLTAS